MELGPSSKPKRVGVCWLSVPFPPRSQVKYFNFSSLFSPSDPAMHFPSSSLPNYLFFCQSSLPVHFIMIYRFNWQRTLDWGDIRCNKTLDSD
ncbi:hypothetical protein S83_033323 [Arachis hypogaea]|uniref:Uncharacterized protein n=1 Tax=Arachis hypogaea TaxID=3818 RepID=A0A445B2S8_ARAHY|nr:hypothetical protein Ahy_A10g047491 isoform B [Arachis hypogaea]